MYLRNAGATADQLLYPTSTVVRQAWQEIGARSKQREKSENHTQTHTPPVSMLQACQHANDIVLTPAPLYVDRFDQFWVIWTQ